MDRWIFRTPATANTANSALAPVVPQQVSQFLLDRRYYLTALQLLTESIKHGRESEVKNLQEFFTDADKFPANLPTKSQNHYVLDLQARMKEQEEKLQVLEYEYRLSKEDVSSLKSQLKQAEQALETQRNVLGSQSNLEVASPTPTPSSPAAVSPKLSNSNPQGQDSFILSSLTNKEHSEGEPTAAHMQELNAAVTAHLLSQGYKFTALSLQEEAGVQLNWNPASGNPLWNLYRKAQTSPNHVETADPEPECPAVCLETTSSSAESVPSPTSSSPNGYHEEEQVLRQQLQAAQGQICGLQEQMRALQEAAAEALAAQASVSFSLADAEDSDIPPRGADTDQQRDQGDCAVAEKVAVGDSAAAVAAGVDLMKMMTEVLPKLSSNLTMKSRQELIPLLQVVVTHHPSTEVRQANLTLLFNLVTSPDSAQREAIINACLELTENLGADWAAGQLLPLCVKALNNQSAERRALSVELTSALLPSLDACAQFEPIMSILTHLASDRIAAVRECVVLTAQGLLERLPYLRHCYSQLEELLFEFVKDTDKSVAAAVLERFLPSFLHWLDSTDMVATQLLPRTLTTLQHCLRTPSTPSTKPTHRRRSTHGSIDFSADEEVLLFSADQSPPPLDTHQLQLVHLLQLQLPSLGAVIRQTAPAWAYPMSVRSAPVVPPIIIPDDTQTADQGVDTVCSEDDRSPHPPKPSHAKMPNLRIQSTMNSAFTDSPHSCPSSPIRTPKNLTPSSLHPLDTSSTPRTTPRPAGVQPEFATWLHVGEQWRMWRVLSWCLQSMVPQLVSIMQCMAPSHDGLQLRLLVADTLREVCKLLGTTLTKQAVLPMMVVASAGCAPPAASSAPAALSPTSPPPSSIDWSSIPRHVHELAAQLAPASEDELTTARQRVLPFVLGVVLPETGPGNLQRVMHVLMEPFSTESKACWLLEHKGDVKVAVRFAAGFESARAELLELLSHLVHGESFVKTMCGVALAQALAPCVPAPVLSQSVLPALMTLLGAGDRDIKTASIAALGDVSRQLSILPPDGDVQVAVSCQQKIHAIFDLLIQDGGHELQLCVLRTLSKVTTLDERLAGKGMLAQLEYLMQKVQFVLVQMQVSLSKERSPEELRELASLLLCILQATFTCEVKDPKTQAYMSAALQSMQTQRQLLDESQQESLNVMAQAQGSVASPAYTTMPHPTSAVTSNVPPLPSASIASHRPHDPLNAPEVLKNVGAVVSSRLVSRFRGGWRNSKATAAETPKPTADSFFDE